MESVTFDFQFYQKMRIIKITIFFLIIGIYHEFAFGNDTVKYNNKSFVIATAVEGGAYASSIIGLNYLWYKQEPRTSFHFFNDSDEWLQMDKCGHSYSAYWLTRGSYELLKPYAHSRKALLTGTALAYSYMLGIEVLDGFSSAWGASVSDLAANTFGAGLYFLQEYYCKTQIAVLKFSYYPTKYPECRPKLLGRNHAERLLKDYNGQTYWLSVNINSIAKSNTIPNWLNIAVGYGATGMTGGKSNYMELPCRISDSERFRQVYLSLDVDLSKIVVKNDLLKTVLRVANCIKVPFPSLLYQNSRIEFSFL